MNFLAVFGVHDGVAPSSKYVAILGYTTKPADTPADQYFMPRLKSAGSIEQHMFSSGSGDGLSGGTTNGQSQVGFGNISVNNGNPYGGTETIDDWIDLSFRTANIYSVDTLAQPFSQAVLLVVARCDKLVSVNALEGYDITLSDRLADLDKALLTHVYAGTTIASGLGIEGDENLKDQTKTKRWGRRNNVACTPVNVPDLLFQVNDGPVASIAPYDGGLALVSVGDFGNIAALVAATVLAGKYATCLALGVFKIGGAAAGAITADVVEGATIADRSVGQIASRMFTWFQSMYPSPTVTLTPGTVTALDALNDAEAGVTVTGQDTFITALSKLINSIGGYCLPQVADTALFDLGRFEPPAGPISTAVATFDIEDNLKGPPKRIETGDDGGGVPAWKVIVKYDQIEVVQKGDDLFGNVTSLRRAYLQDEWRQVSVEDTSVLDQYPNAPILTFETALTTQVEALAEATRRLAIYSVRRDVYQMELPFADAEDCVIGAPVELISKNGRMQLGTETGTGKLFVVIGRKDDFSADPPATTIDFYG